MKSALRRQADRHLQIYRALLDGQDTALAITTFVRNWTALKRLLTAIERMGGQAARPVVTARMRELQMAAKALRNLLDGAK